MRKYGKEIVLVLITTIIVSAVSVSATMYFNSENVTFTPTNTDWNVTNTSAALNDLYSFTTNGNASASDILIGKTALVGGQLITGSMANNGALAWKPESGTTYTVPAGYYSGGTLDSTSAYNAGFNAGKTASSDIKHTFRVYIDGSTNERGWDDDVLNIYVDGVHVYRKVYGSVHGGQDWSGTY